MGAVSMKCREGGVQRRKDTDFCLTLGQDVSANTLEEMGKS